MIAESGEFIAGLLIVFGLLHGMYLVSRAMEGKGHRANRPRSLGAIPRD